MPIVRPTSIRPAAFADRPVDVISRGRLILLEYESFHRWCGGRQLILLWWLTAQTWEVTHYLVLQNLTSRDGGRFCALPYDSRGDRPLLPHVFQAPRTQERVSTKPAHIRTRRPESDTTSRTVLCRQVCCMIITEVTAATPQSSRTSTISPSHLLNPSASSPNQMPTLRKGPFELHIVWQSCHWLAAGHISPQCPA